MNEPDQYTIAKRRIEQFIDRQASIPGVVMPRRGGGWIFTRPDHYDEQLPCEGDYRCTNTVYPNDVGDDGRAVCYDCLCEEVEWA